VSSENPHDSSAQKKATILASLGVVFGDIGTSPLYALRESFAGANTTPLNQPDLLGVLSLIIWALILVITLKYLVFVLRADNQGEGGIIALVALLNPWNRKPGDMNYLLMIMGLFGACLLYGDGTITPAISVLSAVEGLEILEPSLAHYVVPLTLVILVGLFSIQRFGSGKIGGFFGPIMLLWFLVLAILGLRGVLMNPSVLVAFNPWYAITFFQHNGTAGFLTLGAVFLVVTGGETLYADLGHFGISPIRRAWLVIVFPALLLNYLGQAALLTTQPDSIVSPFFKLAPDWALMPLILLATVATIIASQAVISGAFSLTRQAIHLGQLPRMRVIFTQADESGQIYLPMINWLLMMACIGLVVGFKSSSALASAYGIAVSMDMVVTTILAVAVARRFKWHPMLSFGVGGLFLLIDSAFLGANLVKIPDGGWYALLIAGLIFNIIWVWRSGRALLASRLEARGVSQTDFLKLLKKEPPFRIPGTAVILTSLEDTRVPAVLMQHIKCTHVLHERIVFLTVVVLDQPHVPAAERLKFEELAPSIFRLKLHYGFSQPANIPLALKLCEHVGIPIDIDSVIYIVGRETLIAKRSVPGLPFFWQEIVFTWLSRNNSSASNYYRLPDERVLELGLQIGI